MPEFLAENNVCGQSILQLVSRGNAIIAEFLRLKDFIPHILRLNNKLDVQKYGEIIMDFSYFKIAEAQEQKIESSENLRELDEELRDNHIDLITRFYLAFESIHTYITDLNHFLDELEKGVFIHQSVEIVFGDMEGKQLMCEALYLYGLMLFVVDTHIEGVIRERLLVSYYRYTPQRRDTQHSIDEVCKLLRDTGYSTKRPNNYPEDYFKRIAIDSSYVDIVIGRLRSDDVYNQLTVYPLSKHRSTALATQAAMLYVCLFFCPSVLHSQTAKMREIVDKYFPDNWVISLYMGFTVNLVESWESFKAAKQALNNTLEMINIKGYANSCGANESQLLQKSSNLLKEGIITNDNILDDINNIYNILRDCNVTVRWQMLHTVLKPGKSDKNKKCKQLRDIVITESKYSAANLFRLLLNTAQLELNIKEILKNLLAEKGAKWEELKKESFNSLIELSEVFSGVKPLTRIKKNVNLQKWFLEISKEVESLGQENSASARKIIQLIQALEEVQQFHQLESNMQVIQFLSETLKFLHQMIKNMNVKEDILITLEIIGDLSYAWELIDSFTPIMQFGIKRDPTVVIKLRAIFLKLASAVEIPLLRINQAHSEDLISVSQYYSGELETYVRKVLQIIPEMMFGKMARVIEIQTSVLKELPTRLEKDKLKEYAQLNERFELAELTHSISILSEGMRMMKRTLVGVVCLDPKKLLEDGIRKELVQHISKTLHLGLVFSANLKPNELEQNLKALGHMMNGYKNSFEYMQDYININGLKIWQEEVTRIINYNTEQECNDFLRNKVHAWDSAYQNRFISIPNYLSLDTVSKNFIGRLAREIIRLTDPRISVYVQQTSTWYDMKTQKPVFNKQIFSQLSAIEITGLVGIDKLFSFMIITNIHKILDVLQNNNLKSNAWSNIISSISNELKSYENISNTSKFYQNCINRTTKIWTNILDYSLSIGQLQLLKNNIAFELNKSCKFNAKNLESSLASLSVALLKDIRNDENKGPSEDLLFALSDYFNWTGMNNPFNKVYVIAKSSDEYAVTLFIFVIAHLQKLCMLQNAAASKRSDQIDGVSFITAIATLIKQFHPMLNLMFIKHMSQYVIELTRRSIRNKGSEIPNEAALALVFLEIYAAYSEKSREYFKECIPEEIIHLLHSIATVSV